MRILENPQTMGAWRDDQAGSLGFVPTMGALHEGHLALISEARKACDRVVVSIYVNPLQFGAGEDFDSYPRDLRADADLLEPLGVDVVFHPVTLEEGGTQTRITNPELSRDWCGASRPGHFDGVLAVVTKLFNIVRPTDAWFGMKDYQQLALIRRWVSEMHVPVQIHGHPVVREADGLARSSRNSYLSADERTRALGLNRGLVAMEAAFRAGDTDVASLVRTGRSEMKGLDIEYLGVADPLTLEPLGTAQPGSVALVAAKSGSTRLIDNRVFDPVN